MPWLLLVLGLVSAALAGNALRPVRHFRLGIPAFLSGWLTSELPLHHLFTQASVVAALIWKGALRRWPGWVGLALALISWVGLVVLLLRAKGADEVVEASLVEGLGHDYRLRMASGLRTEDDPGLPLAKLALPLLSRRDTRVEKLPDIAFTDGRRPLKLDVYRPRERTSPRPVLLYIHGGGWVLGDKREQGVPMMEHLATKGWICVTANYRLSPRATFPDHVVDVKRAIRWVRDHIAEYGGDPRYVAISGGSAGGHLASLAALTPNEPALQPGFEDADTSIEACVPFYGVYDFTNREGLWHSSFGRFLERAVMKVSLDKGRDRYELASPMSHIGADAVPFMVVHGTNDTLVPVDEARLFVRLLRAASSAPVVYAELPGAQHAFELLPSLRTMHIVRGVERFLAVAHGDWERAQAGQARSAS